MSQTAYLLVWLDPTQDPPVVVDVGIYSEGPSTITTVDHTFPALILEISAPSYDAASKLLRDYLRSSRMFSWALPWIEKKL